MRLAVYNDQAHWREGDHVYTARAFVLFLGELAHSFDRLVLVGRLQPETARSHYRVPDNVEFAALPGYESSARPLDVVRSLAGSVARFWRVLREVDAVWVLGPHPVSVPIALLTVLRGKRLVLGVRQNFPEYARNRHPDRRSIQLAANLLEGFWRAMSRRFATVVVGPDLAHTYGRARRLSEVAVSLVRSADIVPVSTALARSYAGELQILSVGRLDPEKNPLLLADVLALLRERDPRWRIVVCGDGPMRDELERRLKDVHAADAADLPGHVPIDGGLIELYRQSHFLLHVSWTEGLPQILFEAFAAGLPVVATAVGGVATAVGEAALLVPPGDAEAAAEALSRLSADEELRARLIRSGTELVGAHTMEAECARLAQFLKGDETRSDGRVSDHDGAVAAPIMRRT